MRSRLARLGLLGVGIVALLGNTTPPALAHTDALVTFTAVATLDGGLDYPCPVTMTKTCPPTLTVVLGLPLENDPPNVNTNNHIEWSGNRRGVTITSTTCTSEGVQGLNKLPPKTLGPYVHSCDFTTGTNSATPNYVQGHCGLSGGQVYVTLSDALGQVFDANIHFTSTATLINFTGHWQKRGDPAQHGKVVGTTSATPAGTPPDPNNSCTNKTARNFDLRGTLAVVQDPRLLPLV